MNRAYNLQRQLGIGDWVAQQGGFVRTQFVVFVTRPGIPGGRHHSLVVGNLSVLDHDPVRQNTAGRLVEAKTALLAFRESRPVEGLVITGADVLHQ
jgi:hypothetical protein